MSHIITRGFLGSTMVTRGYGVSSFTAIIRREIIRLSSHITRVFNVGSDIP